MDAGELYTRWTVRLALAMYVLSLALRASAGDRRGLLTWARLTWTCGYLAFLVHVACAFRFYHHWSHAAAQEATARQTAEVVGLAWGGGLYANYAFALVWGADVCWWWRDLEKYQRRSPALAWIVDGFLAFIAFNATVVFGAGAIQWLGLAACLFLVVVIWLTRHRRSQRNGPATQGLQPAAWVDKRSEMT